MVLRGWAVYCFEEEIGEIEVMMIEMNLMWIFDETWWNPMMITFWTLIFVWGRFDFVRASVSVSDQAPSWIDNFRRLSHWLTVVDVNVLEVCVDMSMWANALSTSYAVINGDPAKLSIGKVVEWWQLPSDYFGILLGSVEHVVPLVSFAGYCGYTINV